MEYTTTLVVNELSEPIAITIGNFDGVHRGHQRLMHELRAMAARLHCRPVVVTFRPHTLMVVRPDVDVRYLTTVEEKLALIRQYGGITDSIVIHFTPEVVAMSAEQFMDDLCTHFSIQGLLIGADFSLGRHRKGDVAFLQDYGRKHSIEVHAVPLEEAEQTRISSTRIRALVSEGNIAATNELLGHPVTLCGVVKHGEERGRLIGFPTANLLPEPHKLLPANGVYAVRVSVQDDENTKGGSVVSDLGNVSPVYNGAANVGVRPTFNGTERRVEVYLLDVTLDLYDKYLTVDFIARLRGEQRFAGIDELKTQISSDVRQARQRLQHLGG